MRDSVFHLATAPDWEARGDDYRAPSLETEGFIHCSTARQVSDVARRHFRDDNDLVLLTIDPAVVESEIVYEDLYGLGEEYPHVYGPLPMAAILSAVPYMTHLEEGMWRETRADPAWMDRILHPDFIEVGRSGRVYDRVGAIASTDYPFEYELPHSDMSVETLGADIALVRYVSNEFDAGGPTPAHRTSIWLHTDRGWRLRFHQGTPLG